MQVKCFSCDKLIELDETRSIMRSEECPHCYANMRSCKMCGFYDPQSYNECRESSADRIVEKEKSNFCDFYKLGSQDHEKIKDQVLSAANDLFKK